MILINAKIAHFTFIKHAIFALFILFNTQLLRVIPFNDILSIEVMDVTLRQLRKQKQLTQCECAQYLGIPLRTYQNYETDEAKVTSIKYAFMMQKLEQYGFVDETHGILTLNQIKEICTDIFRNFDIEYCYLFGSYAKETANEKSDVDLLISTSITGMKYYDLVEALREGLKKKVDVLKREQLNDNPELMNEILKDGIKIYG
ncbi:nucleotidyltransferase domain-containing protein [Dielma fastidiosa]|uniref:HTH cro/C1-type domain-containing protein n=1 Tax=Dielma fastidiosa TaxID=1034346 RepID=A0A318KTR3_9FIRM|nr:nucleotidyltransferase domain-containing protein [Dielma fastidiosa]PXX80022.1 hypothetical protein DES51_10424 [Dielma fastidiosa]